MSACAAQAHFHLHKAHSVTVYERARDIVRSIYDLQLDTPPVLDLEHYFPNARLFADNWQAIRAEALAIAQDYERIPRFHDIMREQADISANDGRDWRMFILRAYGVDIPGNRDRCPLVSSLLRQAPDVQSCVLSFLAPGKHIPQHRGPFRGILRFHLILDMPRDPAGEPAATLEIDGVPYKLKDGECLLWDDTFPHEVWNNSDAVRIALLLDVWRRDMPYDLEILSRLVAATVRFGLRRNGVVYNG